MSNLDQQRAHGLRRFRCRYDDCTYGFAKAEHRNRHERTHSGSKPFLCDICQRQFARKDSLLRHARLHARRSSNDQLLDDRSSGTDQDIPPEGDEYVDMDLNCPDPPTEADSGHTDTANSWFETDILPAASLHGLNPAWEDILQHFQTDHSLATSVDPLLSQFMPSVHLDDRAVTQFMHTTRPNPGPSSHEHLIKQALTSLNYTIQSSLNIGTSGGPHNESYLAAELKNCLDIFLSRSPKIMPLIHEPTFDARQTAPSTLLLMLALGSNLIVTGAADPRAQSLWTLAYTGAVTTWSSMLPEQGVDDACPGLQLVLTAAFGQTYAIMSGSLKLRTIAQVVHPLGFHWARQCGMYKYDYSSSSHQDPSMPLDVRWRRWAAAEVQLRAVLSTYMLDGQIAQFSGTNTSVRHAINTLPIPASDQAFAAFDAATWEAEMTRHPQPRMNFRDFFCVLYRDSPMLPGAHDISTFAVRVVLEGFQSFASERNDAGSDAIGLPSQQDNVDAMIKLYRAYIQGSEQGDDMALRWHSILAFSVYTNVHMLCDKLCSRYNIEQQLYMVDITNPARIELPELELWVNSCDGRHTLLHSLSICDRIKSLASEFATSIHLPMCIFSAAMVLLGNLSAGNDTVLVPNTIDWLTSEELVAGQSAGNNETSTNDISGTVRFCKNMSDLGWKPRKLRVEISGLRLHLRMLGTIWGVCASMEATLDSLSKMIM